jgi:predicted ATPase/DNA-binding CsgD family transcriptional regulator
MANRGQLEGQQLGNYRLVTLLGQGSYAEVYLGQHVRLELQAAIKVLHTHLVSSEAKRFQHEAEMIAQLAHPAIVRILDYDVQDSVPFLVMDYAPGGSLRRNYPKGSQMPLPPLIASMKQVAAALQYAHDHKVIHRDVKPENMLVGRYNEILLSDFGLFSLTSSTTSLHIQGAAGTIAYMAPEQIEGHPCTASDQYSLGVVVYEWLCGVRPFEGSMTEVMLQHLRTPPAPLRERAPTLSAKIEQVVLQALAKDPTARFDRVLDFALALEEAYRTEASSAQTVVELSSASLTEDRHAPKHNLPAQLTSLIGREREVAATRTLLSRPEVRLLTLTGTGGVGKTRLALQVATEVLADFPDGISFVSLAPISDSEFVVPTIAQTLGVKEIAEQPLLDQLKASLREKQFLLLLDNFEQVVSAAVQVADLLAACPELKVVVTSRESLHVRGEQEFAVPPLAIPDLKHIPDLVTLSQYEAVALFLSRAQSIKPDFQMSDANARAVAEICIRLDGLPLAIELAAARSKLLSPQALLARLTQGLALLTSGARDVPGRQQTLRNTIAWSYHLLDAEEQRLFRRLSVFVGGSTLQAIEAICTMLYDGVGYVLEGVSSLLDKSLLQQTEHEEEEPRLILLETIREYGLERLHENEEAKVCQQAHALYYLILAEEAEPHLKGAQQVRWWGRLEREQENMRAALAWLIGQKEGELALRLSGALWWFWYIHGDWSEAWRWLEAALGLPQAQGRTAGRAKALYGASLLAHRLGNLDALPMIEESAALYRELKEKQGLAQTLSILGLRMSAHGEAIAARKLLDESVVLAYEVGDGWILAYVLYNFGKFMHAQGDFKSARHSFEESIRLYRELKDSHELSGPLHELAQIAVREGNLTQSATLTLESLTLARELNNRPDLTRALYWLAVTKLMQGDAEQTITLLEENLVLARELDDKHQIGNTLLTLGDLTIYRGDLIQAETRVKESLSLFRDLRDKFRIALALSALGDIKRRQGDLTQARILFTEGVLLADEVGSQTSLGWNLIGLARITADEGQPEHAAHWFGAAESWLSSREMDPFQRADYERAVGGIRAQLGEKVFGTAWAVGRSMAQEQALTTQDQAVMLLASLTGLPSTPSAKPSPLYPDGLTAREVEVLRLVAHGITNEQVADQLIISPRTVNTHLTAIYSKIGVSSRSGATRYAIEHHLV